ncbi:FCD domain-containing protein [Kribbella yunnanensis]|uniref:FCD domain-containing protein n=1 Tax=Kribbella yunnanensis TaxID=190194 RepID=A0ABN2IKK3_9ACTN
MLSDAPLSRAEHLAATVEEQIRLDGLAAGAAIGTLEELRLQSGFSKPTVSEAVRLLRDRGVVLIKPGRGGGLFVADRGPVVRLRHTLLSVAEAPTTVMDAVELREHLELLVDQGAARCRSDADIDALRRLVAAMGEAADWPAFMAANWALHERIAEICPNAMASAVYTSTLGHIAAATPVFDDDADFGDYRDLRHRVHVELVEAIASGDPDQVAAAVAAHASPPPA